MDENKNLNNDIDTSANTVETGEDKSTETLADGNTVAETEVEYLEPAKGKKVKKEKVKKDKKPKKEKKLKNKALFKRGGYAVIITAAVLAGIIIFNVLITALSKRFDLEFDMSPQKVNSMSKENIDYIKGIDSDVTITVISAEDTYAQYMASVAQQYSVATDATTYYNQTTKLLSKYNTYNDKINVKYVDPQDPSISEITTKYPNENLNYGDIIVTSGDGDNERHKILGFNDIYNLQQDQNSQYAMYGMTVYNVDSNNVETAVTSAIAYVTSTASKKVALLSGHSKSDATADYQTLLKKNNFEIDVISDSMISSISSDYQAVIIAGPTSDFIGSELDAISEFLDNDGKLGKGLIYFADSNAPYLPNLSDFLEQWGVTVGEGILFETSQNNYIPGDPTTMGLTSSGNDDITSGMSMFITSANVPLTAAFESQNSITVTTLVTTSDTVVNAPVGTGKDWAGAGDYEKKSFSGVLQAVKTDYDDDNNKISSYVMAFSSLGFINSEYNEQSSVSNKNITLATAERAVGAEDTGISFVSKTITNESYTDSVTEASTNVVRIIFMFILPLIVIGLGIYIYIRRKNS